MANTGKKINFYHGFYKYLANVKWEIVFQEFKYKEKLLKILKIILEIYTVLIIPSALACSAIDNVIKSKKNRTT
jgi:hypothetical protein